ncbi:MAG: glycosyl hydrolase-related protein [Armatimonadetes bacterium]|nr:glycosyl hydrolase-related protein [Armatimonadota bacterium]
MNLDTKNYLLRVLKDAPAEDVAYWISRAETQLHFARAFTNIAPAVQADEWLIAISKATQILEDFDPASGITGLAEAVQGAERAMMEIGKAAKAYTLYCVGHGHLDMNWMWSWPETVSATHDTFASVLSLMEQYPTLTYSQSQASVYALMERYHPDMFEAIKQRVKEGRWEVTAVHWVEGDKNLSSAESLCRHLLYTRRYFQEKFDLSADDIPIDWEPDTFGHANTIPTILVQAGVRFYYSCRTGGGFEHPRVGQVRPRLFYWQAPDGSRVLVNRESTWYNSYVNIGDNIALPMVNFVQETGLHHWLNVYGIGNHGGGPTRTEIEYYLSLQDYPVYPSIVFGTSKQYYLAIEKEIAETGCSLPVLDHELNFEFPGCYTSESAIKRGNRFGENYLVEAETLALLSNRITGSSYPAVQLREGWLNVLFNQFHDILPGSGVRETREHAQALFQEVGAITGSIKRNAGKAITSRINTLSLLPNNHAGRAERQLVESGGANTPFVAGSGIGAGLTGYSQSNGGGRRFLPFTIYNPCAWTRSERVQVALYDTDFNAANVVALDEQGVANPTLNLGTGSDWGHKKINVAFDAKEIPALGYRTYLLCEGEAVAPAETVRLDFNEWIETPYLKFRIDRYGSGLLELVDKRTGAIIAGADGLGAWEYIIERPRGMTAWVVGGEIDPPIALKCTGFHVVGVARNQGTSVPLGQEVMGYRVDSILEVPGTRSRVKLSLMIHALEPRIDYTAELDWYEIGVPEKSIPGLSVRFPLALSDLTTRYETPFGSVVRDLYHGEEVPTLRYAHVSGTANTQTGDEVYAGLTLVQDSKYGHAMDGSDLRLRIVRSSYDPDFAPEVAQSTLRYSLILHNEPPTPADLTRLGASLNHPLLIVPATLQEGDLETMKSFVQVENSNVVLSALKRSEDGDGLIVRLTELNGEAVTAAVTLAPLLSTGITRATLMTPAESPIEGSAQWSEGTLKVDIPAFNFVTVLLS